MIGHQIFDKEKKTIKQRLDEWQMILIASQEVECKQSFFFHSGQPLSLTL